MPFISGSRRVHERNIRPVLPELLDRLATVRCFGNEVHVRLIPYDRRDPFTQQRVIVNAENANSRNRHLRKHLVARPRPRL
jgi:hypothetical protein